MFVNIFKSLGFTEIKDVRNRHSIADLYNKRRTGIYLLLFANGEYYIGQSVDVVTRFSQHKKMHDDIVGISFIPKRKSDLDNVEKYCINFLEQYVSMDLADCLLSNELCQQKIGEINILK